MPSTDEYIGKTVASKYRIEEMIGEGGMGKVYKATQILLGKPVVLKVLRQALLSDERTVARFQREAKAASRLNHPNSISVLDFGQASDGALFIAMEYVQGCDLHQILSREWPLPESRVVRIVAQVLSALSDAHSAGVIHRDLKPENIMVEQRRGAPDFVKVLDFGIAKIIDGSADDGPALTRAGFVCGTPEYMSPEQARGAILDNRSDLYAVGVILYQLTTGVLPFDSDTAVGFATKHLTEMPRPPTKRRPDAKLSPPMERLIMRALSKDPNDRPQTAEQFRAELLAVDQARRATFAERRNSASHPQPLPIPLPIPPPAEAPRHGAPVPFDEAMAPTDTSPKLLGATDTEETLTAPEGQPVQNEWNGWRWLKISAVIGAAFAMGFTVLYALRATDRSQEGDVPLANVPRSAPEPLWALEVAQQHRRPVEAARLEAEGDRAWQGLDFLLAYTRYTQAWQADPRPALALKLGEVAMVMQNHPEARGWWARFRREAPQSPALEYVDAVLPKADP